MGLNLGTSLGNFCSEWEKSYLSHKGVCEHHDFRFDEGWIPLSMEPYSPALGRFRGKNELAVKIVQSLEEKGQYIFKDNGGYGTLNNVEHALGEIMFNVPFEIAMLIADHGVTSLMLDRKAFTIDGGENNYNIQWYIRRGNVD